MRAVTELSGQMLNCPPGQISTLAGPENRLQTG